MANKDFLIFVGIPFLLAIIIIAGQVWAKYELCSKYYPEISPLVCYMSNSTLPQRTNR